MFKFQKGSFAIFIMIAIAIGVIAVLTTWHKETDTPLFEEKEVTEETVVEDDIVEVKEVEDES